MTIEEAEVRANAGDIEYMLLLGEYYAGQGGIGAWVGCQVV